MSFASKAKTFCLMCFLESKGFNHLRRNLKCLVFNGSFSVGLTMNLIGSPSITRCRSNGNILCQQLGCISCSWFSSQTFSHHKRCICSGCKTVTEKFESMQISRSADAEKISQMPEIWLSSCSSHYVEYTKTWLRGFSSVCGSFQQSAKPHSYCRS